jgi:hypothetical protein
MKRKAGRRAKSVGAKGGVRAKSRARGAARAKRADPIDTMVAASAHALGLTLDPAWHKSIAFNLRLTLRLAALVDEFVLPDDAEPAPVFHA